MSANLVHSYMCTCVHVSSVSLFRILLECIIVTFNFNAQSCMSTQVRMYAYVYHTGLLNISVKYKVFTFSINFEGERAQRLHGCIVKLPCLRL